MSERHALGRGVQECEEQFSSKATEALMRAGECSTNITEEQRTALAIPMVQAIFEGIGNDEQVLNVVNAVFAIRKTGNKDQTEFNDAIVGLQEKSIHRFLKERKQKIKSRWMPWNRGE